MARLSLALALLSLLCGTLFAGTAARSADRSSRSLKRLEAAKRLESSAHSRSGASNQRRATDTSSPRVKNITFTNTKASGAYARVHAFTRSPVVLSYVLLEFYVNGAAIPLVNFDVGPSWSGLMPISSAANETRKVSKLLQTTSSPYSFFSCSSGSFLRARKEV